MSAPDTRVRWVEIAPGGIGRRLALAELWEYRDLARVLAARDLTSRYRQAAFGIAWAALQPIASAVVLYFVFRRLANVPSEGLPFFVFVFAGFAAWSFFVGAVGAMSESLIRDVDMVTKVYFPRLLIPLSTLLVGAVNLLIALAILAVAMTAWRVAPGPALLTLPAVLVLLLATASGPGLLLAAVHVRYRDTGPVTSLLLQIWFFATPVAYPSSLVDDAWRWLYFANPMAGCVDLFRWSALGAPFPGPPVLASFAVALLLLVAALRYFAAAERRFADVI